MTTNPKITSKEALRDQIRFHVLHLISKINDEKDIEPVSNYIDRIMSAISDYEEGIVKRERKMISKGLAMIMKEYPILGTAIKETLYDELITHPKEVADKKGEGDCGKCLIQACKCYNENLDLNDPCLNCANGDHDEHCQPTKSDREDTGE